MENRREQPRTTVVKNAVLYFKQGEYSIPCIILDHSDTGAKIRINNVSECPPMDDLRSLITSDKSQVCRCIWTNKNELGIKYIGEDIQYA